VDEAAIDRWVEGLAVALAVAGGTAWLAIAAPAPTPPPGLPTALEPRSATSQEGPTGVVQYDAARSAGGVNLVVSGHAAAARLLAMDGTELAHWAAQWPDPKKSVRRWEMARLLPDGGLLALCPDVGLLALDRQSQVTWSRPAKARGDVDVLADGRILALAVQLRRLEEISHLAEVADDVVLLLGADGANLSRTSTFDLYRHSPHDGWKARASEGGPLLGVSSVERIGPGMPAPFAEGNLLVAAEHLGEVGVLDPAGRRVVWSMAGPWDHPRDAHLLPDGALLVADHTRVTEVEPTSLAVRWEYAANADTAQRLPNGNTLVVEAAEGRAQEVAPTGEAVWVYVNPDASPEDPARRARLAVIRAPEAP
jgi:hypothetical protein